MHSNCRLLLRLILCKIRQRNNIRRGNTCEPALKLLNDEITSDIQKHKQNLWKKHLDTHWYYMHNICTLWKTIHGLSKRAPPTILNNIITFSGQITTTLKHIVNCFTKQCQTRNTQNKHIGLAFLTSMLKIAVNNNIIPHLWKLTNMVPIPKSNKDNDKGTS